tara:strand:+ start:378 stop:809 length:432 start_codon:yes stop_codon:yes gene_type:complete
MNIQSNLKNVLDKFPKDEVKLASHKVELTAIQDIKKRIDDIKDTVKTAKEFQTDIEDEAFKISNLKDKLELLLNEADGYVQDLKSEKSEVKELKGRVSSLAKDLGVDLKSIKGINDLDMALEEALTEADNLKGIISIGKREIK